MLTRRILRAALLLSSIAGCAHADSAQDSDLFPTLRPRAAADSACPPTEIHSSQVGANSIALATGCGKQGYYSWNGDAWESPADRAAFELNCPKEQLSSTPLGPTSVGVAGCGQRAVYLFVEVPHEVPRWVMNSASTESSRRQ